MACKRSATTDLNHDNWNEEETPEEPGTFSKASDDILEKRVLKIAKRRITKTEDSGTASAFSSFTGFKTLGNANPSAQFSFLSNFNSGSSTKSSNTTNGSQSSSENGTNEGKPTTSSFFSKECVTKSSPEKATQKSPKKSTYYSKLKGLNESVSQWIKTHVDTNPYCFLTPIFKDYEKYLKEIKALKTDDDEDVSEPKEDKKGPVTTTEPSKPSETSIFSNVKTNLNTSEKSMFPNVSKTVFGNVEQVKSDKLFTSADSDSNPFFKNRNSSPSENTATKTDTKTFNVFSGNTAIPSTFSFGQSTVGAASAGFSFGSGKPFTFGAAAKSVQESSEKDGKEDKKEEDDEPPKPNFKPITEEGSIYEQRCKVFVKKDSQYSDRGVGTLFLKPTPNDKMQLIVRAVNSLGNLLLNTLLTSSTPIKRMKDNTIMIMCLPMPDSTPPPTSVLLRVKTKEDGDALLEALEKHAK